MKRTKTRYYRVLPTQSNTDNLRLQPWYGDPSYAALKVVMEYDNDLYGRVLEATVIPPPRRSVMKKFRCQLVRSQYQNVEFEAESVEAAQDMAVELFDETKEHMTYVDLYDMEEVK